METLVGMEDYMDLEISSCSTTTTKDDTWNEWSPVVDWDTFSGDDDFRDLIESMMVCDGGGVGTDGQVQMQEPTDSIVSRGTFVAAAAASGDFEESATATHEDFNGLRLVHLLMAAAEALTGVQKSRELARVILVRLKELVSPTNGTNMERLAAYFTDALQGLLDGAGGAHGKHDHHHHHPCDVLAAFQLLQDMSPYVKFGHFTANQAILEAVVHDRRVHIVDYDIMEGIQWASLMQALISRKDGLLTTTHLRITALTRGSTGSAGRKSISTVQETGRRLVAFAASIGQPFSFHVCKLDSDENFRPSALKLVKGEALVVNCMLHLPHSCYRAPESVASFLTGTKTLGPRIVTLVEEEVGPTDQTGFVGRFMDSLHHYSAVYDSLEAGFPMQGRARALVERIFLGPRIAGTLARIYHAPGTDDEDGVGRWGDWMGKSGFDPVCISFFNHCQAKLLLGLFNDGFRVEELGNNKMALGWKSRRLLSASIWASSPSSPSSSSSTSSSSQSTPTSSDFIK